MEIRGVQWDVPIAFLGGHSHIRDYKKYDSKSAALESGRYMETIGFMGIDGLSTHKDKDKERERKRLWRVSSLAGDISITTSSLCITIPRPTTQPSTRTSAGIPRTSSTRPANPSNSIACADAHLGISSSTARHIQATTVYSPGWRRRSYRH